MTIAFSSAALNDVTRQFRYYLVAANAPAVALRFEKAIRETARLIVSFPRAAPAYPVRNPTLAGLRSWPVAGFNVIRFYFLGDERSIRVVRILHGKRNVRRILEREPFS